jgi:phosphohistidine phosphatase
VLVYLCRHAHSASETPGFPDAARHLTDEGRRAARQLGDKLRWYDCVPTAIWTSPLTRAVQTAELIAGGLGWTGLIESVPALAPGGDVHEVEARLRGGAPDAQVIVVGHEPSISGLGSVLCARADFPALKKAQMARLDDVATQRREPPGPLVLRWLFSWGDEAPLPDQGKTA